MANGVPYGWGGPYGTPGLCGGDQLVVQTRGDGVDGVPLELPRKPNVAFPPGAMLPFQLRFEAVMLPLLPVRLAFHDWVMDCPLGIVHFTVQLLIAELPALVTVTSPWKPPCHELTTL